MSTFKDYKKVIMEAAHDDRLRLALSRAIKSFRANINDALEKFPHTIDMAEEVREIKEKAIGEMENLARQASQAIEGRCQVVAIPGGSLANMDCHAREFIGWPESDESLLRCNCRPECARYIGKGSLGGFSDDFEYCAIVRVRRRSK